MRIRYSSRCLQMDSVHRIRIAFVVGMFIGFQIQYSNSFLQVRKSVLQSKNNVIQLEKSRCNRRGSIYTSSIRTELRSPSLGMSSEKEYSQESSESNGIVDEEFIDIDLRTNVHTSLSYNQQLDRFVQSAKVDKSRTANKILIFRRYLKSMFIPDGISSDYYNFMVWRIVQRFVNAILHVFGTQSLLLALGGSKKTSLTQAAALNWILKDTLGKLTRLIYGGLASNKLDADAKRWRFRGSLMYAFGNFLEIITYIFPSWFLLLGTVANSFKQISMLTSSATRNTILSNFSVRGNIGDITAKGEAQIAVVDLLGIGCGIKLSKLIGIEKFKRIILLYIVLQAFELLCLYKEISSVVFRRMNFERLWTITSHYIETTEVMSPSLVADNEKIFLAPDHFSRRSVAYGSISRAKINPEELEEIRRIFAKEKYLIVIGKNQKKRKPLRKRDEIQRRDICYAILHSKATNEDILKSTLNLGLLRVALSSRLGADNGFDYNSIRSSDVFDLLEQSKAKCDEIIDDYKSKLDESEWQTEFLFGRCSKRSQWPLDIKST